VTRKVPSGRAVTEASIGFESGPTAFTLNLAVLNIKLNGGVEENGKGYT
jgi:hypothetical protein